MLLNFVQDPPITMETVYQTLAEIFADLTKVDW